MLLTIARYHFAADDTLGLLFVNGLYLCSTLEDEEREVKVYGETCIPEGVYDVGLRYSPKMSPRYGHKMLHILGVPDFQYIYFHKGNKEKDTDGCVLVGHDVRFNPNGNSMIMDSGYAYERLYHRVLSDAVAGSLKVKVTSLRKKNQEGYIQCL